MLKKVLHPVFSLFRKIPKKFLVIGIIVLAIGGLFWFNSTKSKSEPLTYAQVQQGDIKETITASGTLTGKNSATLHFKSGGKLIGLYVEENDVVKAGQQIANVDANQQAVALQQAQNTLRDKQATVDKILDDIIRAQNGSTDETEIQKQARTTAQVARDNAYDGVKAAQSALTDTALFSPIDGIITNVPVVQGQNVTGADTIIQVVDQSEAYFDGEVDEADISKVNLNQEVDVTLNSYPDQTFKGTVEKIVPQTKTLSSGATVIIVKVKLATPPPTFIADSNGDATVTVAEAKNVLYIPQDTLVDDNTVLVPDGKSFKKITVTTGLASDSDIEIKSGLTANQTIITNPQVALKK